MNWPAVLQTKTRRVFALFALAELSLVLAIPFLAVAGVHAVLESRTGAFVQQVGPTEPGWRALVEPSSVVAIVERYEGQTTGVTLIVHEQGVQGGAIVVVPGNVTLGDTKIEDLPLEVVIPALSETLKLRIDQTGVVDETMWPEIVGTQTYTVDNTDLVDGGTGQSFTVGEVTLSGENVGDFIGSRESSADSTVLLSRRLTFWSAVIESPPASNHLVASVARSLTQGNVDIFEFPAQRDQKSLVLDEQNVPELVSRAVPFPAGAEPHHRIRLRVLDRTGDADLPAIASQLGAGGFEVVEMGNASEFDDGPSELLVPSQWTGPDPAALVEFVDVSSKVESVDMAESIATLIIGDDFSLVSA